MSMIPEVIYQDEDILVLNKPAGLVVDRSNTQNTDTLEDILLNQFGIKLERSGIVHRLDKDTSGVILVAKNEQSLVGLQQQFQDRTVKKEYLTLTHGLLDQPKVVDASIGRNPHDREKFTVLDHSFVGVEGKDSVTEFEPIKRLQLTEDSLQEVFSEFNKIQMRKLTTIHYNFFTLIKCLPKTGRTHQIRVHLRYIDLPIVSDDKYTGRKVCRLDRRWCKRMFLHARSINFVHPVSGKRMSWEASLPDDLEMALARLEQIK